ncbi:MAG: bifunctional phosphoglucose/phosphomannose isomerase, partial [Candidatus Limnocylindria bacterium]
YKHPDDEPGRRPEEDDGPDPDAPPAMEEAITLDSQAVLARIDRDDMLGRVRDLPRQLAQARQVAAGLTLSDRHRSVDLVVVLGMGGSAIGADLVAAGAGERLRVPLLVQRDYHLPNGIGERSLIVAASHSGETIETVTAAAEARARGLPMVVIAAGGALGREAAADGTPWLRYEQPGQPRAALGWSVGLLQELLAAAGLIRDPDPLGSAVAVLDELLERMGPGVETDANPAKQLAWSILGRIPVVYGAGIMAPVARRWKTQLNENAKSWASFEPMPEANHNAIEGSLNPRELSDAPYVIEIRDPAESPDIAARYRVVEELLGERATNRATVWGEGPTPLARILSAVAWGDLVSVYLAILYQTDPTPVTLLAMLKERLARSD